ncbi:MAG: hypothetical protein MK226_18155 [Saprospiraceae bacterium]|jgi:hypothetical protein|nr:hypothetical protein [Saprospiraceae bacterium]
MRLVINLILVVLAAALVYVLISTIQEPIAFKAEKEKRERAVIDKLMTVRIAQEAFRSIKGGFAPSFDSLEYVLNNDSFAVVKIIGDPDDPNFTGEITYDTTMLPAKDSMINGLNISLDSLRFVPFTNGVAFEIQADTITYQSTTVPVVEVGVRRKLFMGDYGKERFARYDAKYNPNSPIKFGDMNAPNLAGNWER